MNTTQEQKCRKTFVLVLSILSCLFATGCSSVNSRLINRDKLEMQETIGTVQVSRLLTPTKHIPVTEESRSLYEVYSQSSRSAQEEVLARKLDSRAKEDLLVLNRGRQFWYFQKELLAVPKVGLINLMPNDIIFTSPSQGLDVFDSRDEKLEEGEVLDVLISGDAARKRGQFTIQEDMKTNPTTLAAVADDTAKLDGEKLALDLASLQPSEIDVVTRIRNSDGTLHHAVIPQDVLNVDRGIVFYKQVLKAGDVIQFSWLDTYFSMFE